MRSMGSVIELARWRSDRPGSRPAGERPEPGRPGAEGSIAQIRRWHPADGLPVRRAPRRGAVPTLATAADGPWPDEDGAGSSGAEEFERLERAVQRLDRTASRLLASGAGLETRIETELLAVIGQVTMGMIGPAATRAERLADHLGSAKAARR